MNLNIDKWQEFTYNRIFDIKKGFYNKRPESSGLGNIPFLSASDSNNGITDYYTYEEIESSSKTGKEPNEDIGKKIFPKNALCVTNNGSVGFAYYQNSIFTCSHDVNPLYIKDGEFNEYTAMFVASVIMHDRYRWGYGRKWRPERMANSVIKLPIVFVNDKPKIDPNKKYSNDGYIPDWKFMEKYIKSLNYKKITTKNKSHSNSLDIKKWKMFSLAKLFDEPYKAEHHVKQEMTEKNFYDDNVINFVSRTDANNGVDALVLNDSIDGIERSNCIIVGDTTSTIYYQPYNFVAGDHIVVLRSNWLNKYNALFIKTILEKERYRYSYGRAFKSDLIKKTYIPLPIKYNNENPIIDDTHKYSDYGYIPDFEFMEKYIKELNYGDRI